MAKKLTSEQMAAFISAKVADYLNSFKEENRENKKQEIDVMEREKAYRKIQNRINQVKAKESPIYSALQFIKKCNNEEMEQLKKALQAKEKSVKKQLKAKAKKEAQKALDKYNKASGDTLTIQQLFE